MVNDYSYYLSIIIYVGYNMCIKKINNKILQLFFCFWNLTFVNVILL
jgi:hypothetical protein